MINYYDRIAMIHETTRPLPNAVSVNDPEGSSHTTSQPIQFWNDTGPNRTDCNYQSKDAVLSLDATFNITVARN